MSLSRRDFVRTSAASALGLAIGRRALAMQVARMRGGCAAITWGNNDLAAIADISALGVCNCRMPESNRHSEPPLKPFVKLRSQRDFRHEK